MTEPDSTVHLEGGINWTGGQPPVRPRRRLFLFTALAAAAVVLLSGASGLWLVAAPIESQSTTWYWFQATLMHTDAGDRFLTGIERKDRRLFESAVSKTCGENRGELCFTWRYDDAGFHKHWGHLVYKNRDGDRVSLWNVNRLLDGYLGPEEMVQAWGFVLDERGLVKGIL